MPRKASDYQSHGDGIVDRSLFGEIGTNVILEHGVLVFHAINIRLGSNIYIGHQTILKGYHRNLLEIGDNTWIGQQCFFHSAGGIAIGRNVGIGPGVKIISSYHSDEGIETPILLGKIEFAPVVVEDDCDIGVGAIVLPGVRIGRGVQVGAGAVVTRDVPDFSIVAGIPAKLLRSRTLHHSLPVADEK
jgi:serine acetyltransferase